jgi:hypothetical protein
MDPAVGFEDFNPNMVVVRGPARARWVLALSCCLKPPSHWGLLPAHGAFLFWKIVAGISHRLL